MASKEWFSAAELAELTLPGLPSTPRGVLSRAKAERWPSRPRRASGGGREYHLEGLPARARMALRHGGDPLAGLDQIAVARAALLVAASAMEACAEALNGQARAIRDLLGGAR